MKKYIIDANLPYYFLLWSSNEYIHVKDLDDEWTDSQIWEYAKANNLTIVTKDADFSDRILLNEPPPRVIHIRFGNMKLKEFYETILRIWNDVCKLSNECKLVNVFQDRIEGVK
jgi:predicted nuclease of predicted toxin-antitoxin system